MKTFKQYILQELMMDVDPADPARSVGSVKRAAQLPPERTIKQQRVDSVTRDKAILQNAEESPQLKALKHRKEVLVQQVAQLEQQIQQIEQMEKQRSQNA